MEDQAHPAGRTQRLGPGVERVTPDAELSYAITCSKYRDTNFEETKPSARSSSIPTAPVRSRNGPRAREGGQVIAVTDNEATPRREHAVHRLDQAGLAESESQILEMPAHAFLAVATATARLAGPHQTD